MDRLLQASGGTISTTFNEDGAVVDPGTVTVGITRNDGTTLVAPGAATQGTGAAARTYTLSTSNTSALDVLTVTWTSPTKGTRTTYVEVVGGFFASVADIRAESPLSDTVKYPTATVLAARVAAEQALEDACSVAFVPRYARETRNGNGSTDIRPYHYLPIALTSATVNGSAVTDAVIDTERGTFYRQAGWGTLRQSVVLTYTHGFTTPPGNCARVIAKLVKWLLIDSPISDRAVNIVSNEGSQFLVTAGVRGAIFNIPEANAFVEQYGVEVNIG